MSSAADGHTDICKQGVGQASFPHYNGKPKQLTLKLYDLSFRWKASTQGQEWWQTCLSYTIKEYFQVGAGQKNTAARERPAMLLTISKSPVTFAMCFLVPAPEDHFRK